jgi:hypothetical protein
MNEEQKPRGPFANEDLDAEVGAADDTGLIAQQQEINAVETSLPEDADEDSKDR